MGRFLFSHSNHRGDNVFCSCNHHCHSKVHNTRYADLHKQHLFWVQHILSLHSLGYNRKNNLHYNHYRCMCPCGNSRCYSHSHRKVFCVCSLLFYKFRTQFLPPYNILSRLMTLYVGFWENVCVLLQSDFIEGIINNIIDV